tara:strand:+ start:499 stop:642 length:144 start_codon:yes stop_codon:yes gene_type:complete
MKEKISFYNNYFSQIKEVTSKLDKREIEKLVDNLVRVKKKTRVEFSF